MLFNLSIDCVVPMDLGDYIVVKTISENIKGTLVSSRNTGKIVLKLDSGYNITIRQKDIKAIDVIKAKKQHTKSKLEKETRNPSLKNISIFHTGGTFASRVDYETGAVSASFNPNDIISLVPEVRKLANIKSRLIRNMFSEDINFAHYNLLANEIVQEINSGNCDGIIITHGTDTMHYTSAALSFMIENVNIPIILTGAQRSSDRSSSDSFFNLLSSVAFIARTDFVGVAICMHLNLDDNSCLILPALKTKKMHTSRRDAFRSINSEPIAIVNNFDTNFLSKYERKTSSTTKPITRLFKEEIKVGILRVHPNLNVVEIEMFKNFDGLVIEGYGISGNLPINKIDDSTSENDKIYNALKKLAKKIPVVATSQAPYGRINMNVYSTGRKMKEIGILGNYSDLTTETAFIKLSWLLSNFEKDKVTSLFDTNIRNEINPRSQQDFFLPQYSTDKRT